MTIWQIGEQIYKKIQFSVGTLKYPKGISHTLLWKFREKKEMSSYKEIRKTSVVEPDFRRQRSLLCVSNEWRKSLDKGMVDMEHLHHQLVVQGVGGKGRVRQSSNR